MDHHLSKVSSYKVPYFQVETLLGGKNTFLIFVAAEDLKELSESTKQQKASIKHCPNRNIFL